MAIFGNFILRFIIILSGFTLAIAAAGLFVGIGFYNEILGTSPPLQNWEQDLYTLVSIGVAFTSTVLLGAYSYGVVAIIIVLAEAMRWKSLVANLVMGGICATFLALSKFGPSVENGTSDGPLLVSLSAGFIGGFVYWLIAGRRAGDWLGPTNAGPSKF